VNKHLFNVFTLLFSLASLAQAQSALNITLNDVDGPANARVFVHQIDPQTGDETQVVNQFILGDGLINLPPGQYRADVLYSGTVASETQVIDPFTIEDGAFFEHDFFFEQGTLHVQISDDDGPTNGRIFIFQIDPLTGADTQIGNHFFSGDGLFALLPGEYRAEVLYTLTTPNQSRVIGPFVINNSTFFEQVFFFEKGTLDIVIKDPDGPANGRIFIYQIDPLTGNETQVNNQFISGDRLFSLPPGDYRADINYTGTIPNQTREIALFTIDNGVFFEHDFFFEKGTISINVIDHDGPANGRIFIYQINPLTGAETQVVNQFISGDRLLALPPGDYRADINYTGTTPNQSHALDPFTIRNNTRDTHTLYFPRSSYQLAINDHDGPTTGRVVVFQLDPETELQTQVDNRFISQNLSLELPPGIYLLEVRYSITDPDQSQTTGPLTLADNTESSEAFYFRKGTLDIQLSDQDGPTLGHVFVLYTDPQTRIQTTVTNRSINPTKSIALKPGIYLVQVRYDGITPSQTRDLPGILITDTAHITRNLIFGSDRLTGDFDGDGRVDYVDLFLFADGHSSNDLRFDLDGSSTVDEADYLIFTANFDRIIQP